MSSEPLGCGSLPIATGHTAVSPLAETPDAILDVIDGGFETKIALVLQGLGYFSVAHRNWKLKDTPIPCFDTVLLESPSFCDIDARFLLGTNDLPHPDPQQCLFIWARRGVSAGKGFNNGFFRAGGEPGETGRNGPPGRMCRQKNNAFTFPPGLTQEQRHRFLHEDLDRALEYEPSAEATPRCRRPKERRSRAWREKRLVRVEFRLADATALCPSFPVSQFTAVVRRPERVFAFVWFGEAAPRFPSFCSARMEGTLGELQSGSCLYPILGDTTLPAL